MSIFSIFGLGLLIMFVNFALALGAPFLFDRRCLRQGPPHTFAGEQSPTRGIYPVYDTPLGRLGTIICCDLDFTDTARKITRSGAQLILVSSHDWPQIGAKHYTHLVFRAVENRVSLVKADNSGNDSVSVGPYGRIIAAAITIGGDRTGQTLVADVPLGTGDSLAVRLGDWIGWIALAGMVFFIIYDFVTKATTKRNIASKAPLE